MLKKEENKKLKLFFYDDGWAVFPPLCSSLEYHNIEEVANKINADIHGP